MKRTKDVRQCAAEQRIAEEEAQKKGMEEKSREFTEKGNESSKAQTNTSFLCFSGHTVGIPKNGLFCGTTSLNFTRRRTHELTSSVRL
jgi:hypothetical protein